MTSDTQSDTEGVREAFPPQDAETPVPHAPRAERQSINYCPYCSEETLFPLEGGGWECRSCRRAFAVTFKGLLAPGDAGGES